MVARAQEWQVGGLGPADLCDFGQVTLLLGLSLYIWPMRIIIISIPWLG